MPPNSTRNTQNVQLNFENRLGARQAIFYGNINQGMIIGLMNNTWYTVTVTVFNNAGNGLKSEVAHQKTDKSGLVTAMCRMHWLLPICTCLLCICTAYMVYSVPLPMKQNHKTGYRFTKRKFKI